MNDNYDVRYAVGPRETNQMGTQALRNEFLIEQVFGIDQINWYTPIMIDICRWGYSKKNSWLN